MYAWLLMYACVYTFSHADGRKDAREGVDRYIR